MIGSFQTEEPAELYYLLTNTTGLITYSCLRSVNNKMFFFSAVLLWHYDHTLDTLYLQCVVCTPWCTVHTNTRLRAFKLSCCHLNDKS